MAACPYDVIYFNDELEIPPKNARAALTCWKEAGVCPGVWTTVPAVRSCSARRRKPYLSNAEILHPEHNLKTRVYYKNLPKRFIAGTVYDPETEEVVIGATCTISGDGNSTTDTNGFGDFWFEGLPVGSFTLTIHADSKSLTITDINTEKDVNLGTFPCHSQEIRCL